MYLQAYISFVLDYDVRLIVRDASCYHHTHTHTPSVFLYSSLAGSQKGAGLTDQVILICCSAKNFLITRHVLSVTAFCIRIYRAGQGL